MKRLLLTSGLLVLIALAGLSAQNTSTFFPSSGGGGTWGSITGTLSAQTDLQSALDAKYAIASLGANVGTWLATPSSANLIAALTDETGTGAAVFATSPTFGGTLAFAAASGTSLALTGATQTGSSTTGMMTMTQTWNTSGLVTGLLMNITNTSSNANSAFFIGQIAGANTIQLKTDGTVQAQTGQFSAVNATGNLALADSSILVWGASFDTRLYRDAANILAQRNNANAQAFRVYSTFTDASNGEWATLNWASNVLHLGATKNGTGTARVMTLDYGGTTTSAISIPITSGDLTFGGVLAPTGYKSSDGTAGATVTTCTGFKNGLCISGT